MGVCDGCPTGPLVDVPAEGNCGFNIEQLIKAGFQKVQDVPSFTGVPPFEITDGDAWDALITAVDDSKMIISPFMTNLVIPPSEEITLGKGDNSSVNGIGKYTGEGNVTVTGTFDTLTDEAREALKELTCHSDPTQGEGIWIYPMNNTNKIAYKDADFKGFQIYNFRVGSRDNQGKGTVDNTAFSFELVNAGNTLWDDGLVGVHADFKVMNLTA